MGPKKKSSGAGGADVGDGLPTHAGGITGIVKFVYALASSGPGDRLNTGSTKGRGRPDAKYFRVILHHVEEDCNQPNGVVLTPTGKASQSDELSVVFVGDYAEAVQHMRRGNRLKVANFEVGHCENADPTDAFKFDLTADSANKDVQRFILWEFKDAESDTWKPVYDGRGRPMINDSNLRQAIADQKKICSLLDGKMAHDKPAARPGSDKERIKQMRHSEPVYTKLADVKIDPATLWCTYAVISEFSQPRPSKGKDHIMTMTIVDETRPNGLRCSFLLSQTKAPMVRRVGDIVRIHRFKVSKYQDEPQGQADYAIGFTVISCDKPARRGPGDDVDPHVASGGVYFGDSSSKHALNEQTVESLRAFSKRFFADPLASQLVSMEQYSKTIASLPGPNANFDLWCQVVDYTGKDTCSGNFVKLEVRDGTDLPGVPRQRLAAEQLRRGQGKNLVIGSVIPVYINKSSHLVENQLEPTGVEGRPGRWAWVKMRNVSLREMSLGDGSPQQLCYTMAETYACIIEIPPFHHKVQDMLSAQNTRIGAEYPELAGAAALHHSQQQSQQSSQAGGGSGSKSAKGKRAAADAQVGAGPSKRAAGAAALRGGLEQRAVDSITEGTGQGTSVISFTPMSVVVRETKEKPVNKFRVCARLGDSPSLSGARTRPAQAGQMVRFSKLTDRWTGSVSFFLEDDSGGVLVTAAAQEFESLMGIKCSECSDPAGINRLEKKVAMLTAEGAVIDAFIKSHTRVADGEVVYNLYDTRLKN